MTEGKSPDGASARVTSVDVLLDCEELAMATLRLGQIVRLHQAEVLRVVGATSAMTASQVAESWRGAVRPLQNAFADLDDVVEMVRSRQRAISDALDALQEIEDAKRI